jgi:hypothetical protein
MNASLDVIAQFAQIQRFTLSVSVTGPGSVTGGGISCPGTCFMDYQTGQQVTLTATNAPGGSFSGWSGNGNCAGTGSTCTVTMDQTRNVTATFIDDVPHAALTTIDDGSPYAPYDPIYKILDASGSYGVASPIVAYNFDYGDGTSTGWQASSRTPRHTYYLTGSRNTVYTLTVTVRNSIGRESSATTTVFVKCC